MKPILFTICLVLSQNLISQNLKCKYEFDKIDDFTKVRTVRTKEEYVFENKASAFLSSVLIGENNTDMKFKVCADYNGGARSLLFTLSAADNAESIEDFTQLDFLLDNDSVIILNSLSEEGTDNDYKEGRQIYWRFCYLTNEQWNELKSHSIKKLRIHFENSTVGDIEINKKYKDNISNIIKCIDILNLPIQKIRKDDIKSVNSEKLYNNDINGVDIPEPMGNNELISIYKQWIVVSKVNKNEIVKDLGTQIIRFFEDGKFIITLVLDDGNLKKSEGNFQKLKDENTIVLSDSSGKITIGSITKLTNTELTIKYEDSVENFIVY